MAEPECGAAGVTGRSGVCGAGLEAGVAMEGKVSGAGVRCEVGGRTGGSTAAGAAHGAAIDGGAAIEGGTDGGGADIGTAERSFSQAGEASPPTWLGADGSCMGNATVLLFGRRGGTALWAGNGSACDPCAGPLGGGGGG